MLGLAVGIDYALFIVNRHRRQLREGYSVEESIALANGTSGNAVVFAGMTVIIALVALNVTGIPFLGLMGSIGAASVAIAVLIAVTLTPALLSFAGVRVLRRREKARIAERRACGARARQAAADVARARPGGRRHRRPCPARRARRLDAARAPRRLVRGHRLRAVPRLHSRRRQVRRGSERHAPRDRGPAEGDHGRRAARPPGRGREGDLGARRRVGGRAGPDVGRSHHRRLPGRAEGRADERVHRAARGRHPRRLATAWRHHARRRGPDERRDRHLAEARGRAAGLPGGRDGAVAR